MHPTATQVAVGPAEREAGELEENKPQYLLLRVEDTGPESGNKVLARPAELRAAVLECACLGGRVAARVLLQETSKAASFLR